MGINSDIPRISITYGPQSRREGEGKEFVIGKLKMVHLLLSSTEYL